MEIYKKVGAGFFSLFRADRHLRIILVSLQLKPQKFKMDFVFESEPVSKPYRLRFVQLITPIVIMR